ncbi:hypothetical protein PK28_15895 [Hymenobacter sp. DG25B]|uniref:hypothetical protein n=1 Tax=Hymenobacter sp. DG25B TaxID=1385664 RepID=UPI0005410CE3|nr:hypothetical protein [Hymenobacter sp. DG25B]AIZ64787.1 hypothetical protein PK28_15895 [Hymenobacter sp. DG25B]
MEPSADKPTSPQKGDLEYLFRQKFEEAELQPRANLWEQLDHELVVQQNETFRERLRVHRWVAAACVLFMLGMGGWFALHFTSNHEAELAAGLQNFQESSENANGNSGRKLQLAAQAPAANSARPSVSSNAAAASGNTTSARQAGATVAASGSSSQPLIINGTPNAAGKESLADAGAPKRTATAAVTASSNRELPTNTQAANTASGTTTAPQTETNSQSVQGRNSFLGYAANGTTRPQAEVTGQQNSAAATNAVPATGAALATLNPNTSAPTVASVTAPAAANSAATTPATTTAMQATATEQVNALAPRPAALDNALAALPASLEQTYTPTALAWADELAAKDEKKIAQKGGWSFGGGHNLSSFNPNVNFSRGPLSTPTFQKTSATARVNAQTYEEAATEYRHNLQAGLGQRVALMARKRLAGRWSATAGVEAAEYRASSQTSYAALAPNMPATFTGDLQQKTRIRTQMATDLTALAEPQTTHYRYRTAGLPVSLQYSAADKMGWSLYARMGAAVNLLFNSRLTPENTNLIGEKAYKLSSPDSPYRHVLASLRGGAGMQYRPVGATWLVALGPAAETGLNTLNNEPTQSYWHQNRPYSVGLEASVEFGLKPVVAAH